MARLYSIVSARCLAAVSNRLNALAVAMMLAAVVSAQVLEYAMELGAMAGPSF